MKIWCIFKGDTAIKWRELLVVDEPSPLAWVTYNIFGGTSDPFKGCQIPLTMIILSGGFREHAVGVLPVGFCNRLQELNLGSFHATFGGGSR